MSWADDRLSEDEVSERIDAQLKAGPKQEHQHLIRGEVKLPPPPVREDPYETWIAYGA